MLTAVWHKAQQQLLSWSAALDRSVQKGRLRRAEQLILIFCHGYSLAHTLRPLLLGRALRARGYPVEFAGNGPHIPRLTAAGFPVHAVETMPQSRMDAYVARGEYAYYDLAWIDRCVRAEQELIRRIGPALLLGDMRPTLPLSAALEGVDLGLLTAGYAQPGYPFPIRLPAGFSPAAGPFAPYLEQRPEPLQPQRTLYLVADVPQFHPAGPDTPPAYQYVGPLIDTPPEPRTIPLLEAAGWNHRQPLIYLNCGSTGAPPALLEALLEALARRPFRVLVTTAGRWTGRSPSPQIRLAEYLPAGWILRRAALFIGIGGIGSVYHALRAGTPILGAPEHLDQEYHLNRVQDLGLGLKLAWEQFLQPDCLLAALDRLWADYAAYAQRCQAFAPHVQAWQGAAAAVEIVDRHFIARQWPYPVAAEGRVPAAEFVRHLTLSTPTSWRSQDIEALLKSSMRRGLPHYRQGGAVFFDRTASWNWLYDHAPRFFESDYRALEEKRLYFFTLRDGRLQPRAGRYRYRLTYEYRLANPSLPPGQPALLFLPYPLAGTYQSDIRLLDCRPRALQEYLLPGIGFFYAYPYVPAAGQEYGVFSYTCALTVRPRPLPGASPHPGLPPAARRRYTALDPDFAASATARRLREAVSLPPGLQEREKARRLYEYLAGTRRFKKTQDRCPCLACSARQLLTDNGGHCITLTHTFVVLCRLEGIPARPVSGALAGYPIGEDSFEACAHNEPLFGHTWAEIYLEPDGWLPVEFHGIVIGPQALTADNVTDASLRHHICTHGPAYIDYYFGNLDAHRVVCSQAVKTLPQTLVRADGHWPAPRYVPPSEWTYECRLRFTCR